MHDASIQYWRRLTLLSILVAMTAGCQTLSRNPVPLDRIEDAEVAGLAGVRDFWSTSEVSESFQQDIILSIRDEPDDLFPHDANGLPVYSGLAISGGGSYGAYGAGVLCGWSETGTRPLFKLVTGISTGALIAPYAFLGPDYDDRLKMAYTTTSTKDIARISKNPPWNSDGLVDTAPLAEMIARDLNRNMLADIASAHESGRRLYIGTTHLDAQRFMVWNMGAIAASDHPDKLELFRSIMLASASVPGVFPPVYIDVHVDGQPYDEMHVDGGVITQVFFYEFMVNIDQVRKAMYPGSELGKAKTVYVLRNGKVGPEPEQVPRKVKAITARTLSSMTKSTLLNDLYRIQNMARRDGLEFKYAGIPEDYEFESNELLFDPEKMSVLFDVGYQASLEGMAWFPSPFEDTPP